MLFTHYRAILFASLLHVIHPPATTMTAEKHTPSETAALLENGRLLLWNLPPPTLSTFTSTLACYGPVSLLTLSGSLLYLSFSWSYCQVRINRSRFKQFEFLSIKFQYFYIEIVHVKRFVKLLKLIYMNTYK